MEHKICIFSAQYLPHMGGVEKYTYNLAHKLTEKGCDVIIVTSSADNKLREEVSENIRVFRLPSYNLMNGRYPVVKKHDSYTAQVLKKLASEKINLVLINTRFYFLSLLGAQFGYTNHIRTVIIEHGTSHLTVHNRILDWFGAQFEHFITNQDKKYCSEYYGVSLETCKWLRHFKINAGCTLYNAINIDEMNALKESSDNSFRINNNIPEDATVVCFTGRLVEEKGIFPLVSSIKRLQDEGIEVYLVLAGDGPLEKYVNQNASDHIIALGRINSQQVVNLLLASDIFCLPSFSEGFSTSVLEAIACGCYVITTERGGSKELITSKEYGTIIPDNRESYVHDALLDAITHPEQRKIAVKNSYARLISDFTWDRTANDVISLLNQ